MSQTNSIMNTYGSPTIEFDHGEGVWLFDRDGKKYLDALSGIGVCALGHAHPAVTKAICEQAEKLVHTSNLYHIGTQQKLADKLTAVSGMDNVFFANSGAEANEAAIKMARLYGSNKGINTPKIIVFETAFHGRTLATLSAGGNEKIKQGFGPLLEGFVRCPYNDVDAVKALSEDKDIVAILVEPIQGEGGLNVPDADYLTQLRAISDANNWLLMLDEVQTGNGRTGQYFAYQHFDWLPDIVTTAKGLGNGMPIGACLAQGKAAELFQPGHHGSTYGGNPLASAAALATVTTLTDAGFVDNAAKMGTYIQDQFKQKLAQNDKVVDIRGLGLMIGIEIAQPCTELVQKAMDRGFLINVAAGKVIRLLPPLIIDQDQADTLIAVICELIQELD
ncbi:MAG: aspartate aminotransferase family protein [Pseudomonadales bacterium]|nr:aspartate aminotransferase family protein [Pseudomonadales bacterium]